MKYILARKREKVQKTSRYVANLTKKEEKMVEKGSLWVLPGELNRNAPTDFEHEDLWFIEEKDYNFDLDCLSATIFKGIYENDCPIPNEWVNFVVAGGVIAALS